MWEISGIYKFKITEMKTFVFVCFVVRGVCKHVRICVHMQKPQQQRQYSLLPYYAYSLETVSLTEPGTRLANSQP